MTDAVMHIASKGYKRITYLTPDMGAQEKQGLNTYTLRQRTEGYLDGMKGADLLDEVSILTKGSLENWKNLLNKMIFLARLRCFVCVILMQLML